MPAMSLRTVIVLFMAVCTSTSVLGMPQEGKAISYKRASANLAQREIPIFPATVVQPITKRQSDEHSEPPHPRPSGQFRQHDKRQESHPDHPTPSHRPAQKRQHDNGDDDKPHPPQPSHGFHNGDKRRGLDEQESLASLAVATKMYGKLCPVELLPCPIGELGSLATLPSSLAEWNAEGFECVDMMADLHSCGGCASVDASHDCTEIDGALSVSCVAGSCQVYTCDIGYRLSNGTCVENADQLFCHYFYIPFLDFHRYCFNTRYRYALCLKVRKCKVQRRGEIRERESEPVMVSKADMDRRDRALP